MNALSWNCRGLGGPRKLKFLQDALLATRSSVVFLSETKASMRRVNHFMRDFPYHNFHAEPARGISGGLCLIWDSTTIVQILNTSLSYICARICPKDKPPWVLVGVYGDPEHNENPLLWETLTQLIALYGSVCLIGDFNEIVSTDEKYGGRNRLTADGERFKQFIFEAGLVDLGYKGPAFTWTNKRHVSEAIYQRLDRALATPQWLQNYPNAYVNHLPLIHSDHCPILLRLKPLQAVNKDFKFEHWWFS
ncbi:Endonuclease/exonuclease/phosphatase family protein [Rhynchospora pubera]|uniref:Endonuclease/exonuclease/phosphatase family protein n=1 Tax=Rhynchospora pubera TaxID=906938 RepID=A0AAV8HXA3_9POAL|nr:Endonuclease/exonuclease/phosphatase family protein [Rhynchospora pubera]